MVILAIFFQYFQISVWMIQNYVSEQAPINYNQFASIYDVLKQLPYGRLDEIGIYGGAMTSAFPLFTDKPMLTGWYPHGSFNYNKTVKPIHDPFMEFYTDVPAIFIYNQYQKTFTKYIVVYACLQEGFNSYKKGIEPLKEKYKVLSFQHDCILILSTQPEPSYVSKVKLFKIQAKNVDFVQRKILEAENGYLITSLYPNQKIDENLVDGNLIFDTCQTSGKHFCFSSLDNKTVADIISYFNLTEIPLQFEKPNSERVKVYVNEPGWILVKESYFPRWHAYQNGKELPIYISDMGYLLVNAEKGEVIFKNELTWIDYFSMVVSLITLSLIFSCSVLKRTLCKLIKI
jgi:hypothetical protein